MQTVMKAAPAFTHRQRHVALNVRTAQVIASQTTPHCPIALHPNVACTDCDRSPGPQRTYSLHSVLFYM